MEKYYKQTGQGYILAIGTNCGGEEVTREEYMHLLDTILRRPPCPEGSTWRLREDLSWEQQPLEAAQQI